ncbi:hypothetical protein U9M48_031702 [Paspalum notatum var. saurae]|uniref:Uncharacterized protein n=1 Tax=Paspalum notatum var. saurae TaxID=547442 RepID=A0AAQ3U7W2_PASNO
MPMKMGRRWTGKEFRGMINSLRTDGDRAGHSVRGLLRARYRASSRTSHRQAVKRIFGYRNSLPSLVFGFSDADHAGCRIDRKSTSGTCQLLGTSLVSWSSRKQASVSLSTTKRVHRLR